MPDCDLNTPFYAIRDLNVHLHFSQCKELEAMFSASEKRLETLLHSESTTKGIVSLYYN